MSSLTQSSAWRALEIHQAAIVPLRICDLFKQDPQRFDKFSLLFNGILLDYAKQPITGKTIDLLCSLACQQKLESWIARMFAGENINNTEHRAALHSALRSEAAVIVDGKNVLLVIRRVLQQMTQFVAAIHSGSRKGYSGKVFTDVVNIGIGGSDLGPAMATEALKPYSLSSLALHFVSNADGTQLSETLQHLDPATTLFIISSKTFLTHETLTNAYSAREWFFAHGGRKKDIANHFAAVSSNLVAVQEFGISSDSTFELWDWVGGRYSLWSAIGLPIALSIGMENFCLMLAGAREMDRHFITTPLKKNLPVILGLISIWQINFLGATSHAIFPYDQSLRRFPAYLQQLEMESNGKRITRDGEAVDYDTASVVWGEPGTNGQHAFFQLLHQGTQVISIDFLAPCKSHYPVGSHHRLLLANFFAQTEALMHGKNEKEIRLELTSQNITGEALEKLLPHMLSTGNHPTTSILFEKLDPKTLGSLIALYEHKVFVQSVIWNINAFDQWGVALAKQLSGKILTELEQDGVVSSHDTSTNGLINYYKKKR